MSPASSEIPVPPELAGHALDAAVRALYGQSWGKARAWIETGKISVNGQVTRDGRSTVPAGAVLRLNMNAPRSGAKASGEGASGSGPGQGTALDPARVVHCDPHVVVVDKPSGISTVPYDESEKDTLLSRVRAHLGQRPLEIVHRIDKETSGLVVFARHREAARKLANQFRFHTVRRRYLALAHGIARPGAIRSVLIEDRGDGLRGSVPPGWRLARGEGREAITHVRALEALGSATLVECRLETGRTHQIRIHLSEAGNPLLGEKLYIRGYEGLRLDAPRVMLHAAELGFAHPESGAELRWESGLPEDFLAVLAHLRRT